MQLRARFPWQKFTGASVAARIDAGTIVVVAVAIFTLFSNTVTTMILRRLRQAGVIDGIQRSTLAVRAGIVLIDGTLRESSFIAIKDWTHDIRNSVARAGAA